MVAAHFWKPFFQFEMYIYIFLRLLKPQTDLQTQPPWSSVWVTMWLLCWGINLCDGNGANWIHPALHISTSYTPGTRTLKLTFYFLFQNLCSAKKRPNFFHLYICCWPANTNCCPSSLCCGHATLYTLRWTNNRRRRRHTKQNKTKQRKTVIFICAKSTSRPTTHVPVSTRQLLQEEEVVVVVVVQRLRFSIRVVCANYFPRGQKKSKHKCYYLAAIE